MIQVQQLFHSNLYPQQQSLYRVRQNFPLQIQSPKRQRIIAHTKSSLRNPVTVVQFIALVLVTLHRSVQLFLQHQ